MLKRIISMLSLACLLTACAPAQTPASMTVESYLQALADKDETLMLSHICPDYEFDALLEFDALAQVETELKDVSCQQVNTEGDTVLVTCTGSIVSNYGSELFSYDLTGRTYTVVDSGENWLVCGYTR
jgi:hypothetical protein